MVMPSELGIPQELLNLPQVQDFLNNPSVQEGLTMSQKHKDCPEYNELMQQARTALIELGAAVRAHDATCDPYETSDPSQPTK